MKLQNVCAIICTVISVLSWLFGDNVAGRIGEKNMQRLVFAITMGFASYVFLLSTCRTIQFFLEWRDRKRAEEKAATKFDKDFSQLRPEHVDALRELWENKRIVRDESNKNVVLWLYDSGMVRAFTTSGYNLVYKLTEKGEDVCDRLIGNSWEL